MRRATRATRGLINRTIIKTEVCATVYNEQSEELEKKTVVIFSTGPVKDLRKEIDVPEGCTLVTVKEVSAVEKLYGMTPEEFVLYGREHSFEEATEE